MSDLKPVIIIEATIPPKKTKKPKKDKKTDAKKPKTKPSHPPTALMVKSAIESLKERGGSSLQAIKKYIAVTYKVDAEKVAPFIKKYIKNSVTSGTLVQTKGKGASGSFKMAGSIVAKKASKKNKLGPLKEVKLSPGKTSAKKVSKVVKLTSPLKAKSSTKMPTKKPKSPKPKTVKSKAGKSSKKSQK